jgi:formylglycine-generating enzyme required for sulfatase activity
MDLTGNGRLACAMAWTVAIAAGAMFTPSTHAEVIFDWATVGNAGNAADPIDGDQGTLGVQNFGAVSYEYRIATTEVTNAQYTAFLNAVDPTGANALSLFDSGMAGNSGGIELQSGNANGSKFVAQAGRENNPVTIVTWYDSIRFVNWLHNGQGSGSTETGAYILGDLDANGTPLNGSTITRNTGANYFLPSEDEWYKAAYHDASAGMAGTYFTYATGTNIVPYSDNPASLNTPDDTNVANFKKDDTIANGYDDGYAVSGLTTFPFSTDPFTDVGAYTAAASPYGTFDQNGNVLEWNEALKSTSRGRRGGGWSSSESSLRSSVRLLLNPISADDATGFRVATTVLVVPEPASAWLILIGSTVLWRRRRGADKPLTPQAPDPGPTGIKFPIS